MRSAMYGNLPRRDFVRFFLVVAAASFGAASTLVQTNVRADEVEKTHGDGPVIDCDFPGGNIMLERVEGDQVYLHQDQRDTPGFWFYWNFRVRGAAGRPLSFHFTKGNVIGVRGPAISTDGGNTWSWLGREAVDNASFRHTFAEDAKDVRFSFGMPYTEADWQVFLADYKGNPLRQRRRQARHGRYGPGVGPRSRPGDPAIP